MAMEGESDVQSRLAVIADSGVIDVIIFVNKEPLVNSEMDLKIVFTAYKRCTNLTDICGSPSLRQCIRLEYFGDGFVNCPYSKCSDEVDCSSVLQHVLNNRVGQLDTCLNGECDATTGTSTKVTAGAVATLLLSFVVFVLCVWICKKYSKLCWAEDCANPPNRSNQSSRTIELQNRTEPTVPTITPTAPPIEENKDLPPSYDSLFPGR